MLGYILIGCIVFLFLMFLGINHRLGNLELIVASHMQHNEVQIELNKRFTESLQEFNETCRIVQKYHAEIDTWTKAIEERLSHVEAATVTKS